jgi:CRP-like cAMP-binding protein
MWLNRVRKRQVLYTEGNRATYLHAVRSGSIKLVKVDATGREHVTTVLGPGDLFGFEALFDPCYATGAEALTDAEICLASGEELRERMAELPGFAVDMARYLHHQLRRTRERHACLTAVGAPAKLAAYLLQELPDPRDGGEAEPRPQNGNGGAAVGQPPLFRDLTLKDLGGILGLSPETVCRALGTLRDRGLIETRDSGIRVRDAASLRRVAGG